MGNNFTTTPAAGVGLSGASTPAQMLAAYQANCDYEFGLAGGSVAKAIAFIQACAMLLATMPKMTAQDRGSTTLSPDLIEKQLERARMWMYSQASTPGGGSIRYMNTENYRPLPSSNTVTNPDPGGTP